MRKLAIAAVAAALAGVPLVAAGAPAVDANLATAKEANSVDLGCLSGSLRATKFPTTRYDATAHERIMFNISRCTGGFVLGVNTDTWKSWNADIQPNGVITGKDLDGDAWRYDPTSKLYTNLSAGRTCARANLRHVCAQ
jgi:hypothetical protein